MAKNIKVVPSLGTIQLSGSNANTSISVTDDGQLQFGESSNTGSLNVTGDLVIQGSVTAQEFKTEFVSASILYRSGSTKFGDTFDDKHEFTGSLEVSGSINNTNIQLDAPNFNLKIGNTSTLSSVVGTGRYNTSIGQDTGANLTTGYNFTGLGYSAGKGYTTGNSNISIGNYTGPYFNTTDGAQNILIGSTIGIYMTDGASNNVGVGGGSLYYNTSGAYNTAIGRGALQDNASGSYNTILGGFAAINLKGDNNIAIGYNSMKGVTLGSNNIVIGDLRSGVLGTTLDGVTAIGSGSRIDFYADSTGVGIGTTSPSKKLEVQGSIRAADTNYVQIEADQTDSARISMGVTSGTTRGFINVDNTGGGHLTTDPSFRILLNTNNIATFTSNGRLGIGTTLPSHEVHLGGLSTSAIGFGGTSLKLGNYTAIGSTRIYSDGSYLTYSTSNSYHDFTNAGTSLMRITSEGNVGIGTNSPKQKLHISNGTSSGDITKVAIGATGGNAESHLILAETFSGDDVLYGFSFVADGNSTNNLKIKRYFNDTTGSDVIDITRDTGRVGIGTASPLELLDVAGTARFDSSITEGISYAGTGYQHWGDGGTGMNFPADDRIDLDVNSNTRLRITDNIDQSLLVNAVSQGWYLGSYNNGSTYASIGSIINGSTFGGLITGPNSGHLVVRIQNNDNDDSFAVVANSENSASADPDTAVFRVRADGQATFSGNATVGGNLTTTGNAYITSEFPTLYFTDTNGNPDYYISAGNGYFRVFDNTNQVSRLYINSSGNVGIGTTSPNVPLHVSGTFKHEGSQYNIQMIGGSEIRGSNAVTLRGLNSYAAILAAGSIFHTAGTDHIFRDTNSNALVTIKQAGSVGIGTTSPSRALHVSIDGNDEVARFTSTAGNDAYIELNNANSDGVSKYGVVYNDFVFIPSGSETVKFTHDGKVVISEYGSGNFTGTPAYRLSVDSSGNIIEESLGAGAVDGLGSTRYLTRWEDGDTITSSSIYEDSAGNIGIGTTAPGTAKVLIDHTNTKILELKRDGATKARFIADSNNGQLDLYDSSTVNSVRLLSSGVSYLNGGNVGIGTTSPSEKLHVVGDVKIEGLNPTIYLNDTNGADWNIDLEDNHLRFKVDSTEYIRFQNGGNVGIGTTSPSTKLDVNGNVKISGANRVLEGSSPTTRLRNMTALPGGYVESDTFNFRFDESATAYAGESGSIGGTLNQTTGTSISSNNLKRLFTYTADYINLNTHKDANGNVVIELVDIAVTNSANTQWKPYVFFHATSGNVESMTIEVLNGNSTWETVEDAIDCIDFYIRDGFYTTSAGILRGVRYTFTNITGNSYLRMIGVIGKTHASYQWNVLKSGGDMFGDLTFNDNYSTYYGNGGDLRIYHNNTDSFINNTTGNLYIRSSNAIGLYDTDGTSRMYLTDAGNVGIGTTSPSAKLHVDGNTRLDGTLDIYGSYLNVGRALSTAEATLTIGQARTDNGYSYIDLVGDATYTDYGARFIRGNSGPNSTTQLNHRGTGVLDIQTVDAAPIRLVTSATERLRVTSDGKVGIGTASPEVKLDVRGQLLVAGDTPDARIGSTLEVYRNGSTAEVSIHQDDSSATGAFSQLRFRNGGNDTYLKVPLNGQGLIVDVESKPSALVIDTAGNTTIDADLTVSGIVTAQEFHTEFVSASIIYQSGSTKFGDTSDDVHSFTGSLQVLGAVNRPFSVTDGRAFHQGESGGWRLEYGFKGSSGTDRGGFGAQGGNDTVTYYYIGSTQTNPTLAATPGGNVGIGTTSPTLGRLHLVQDSDSVIDGITVEETSGGNTMRLWMDGSTRKINAGGSNTMIEFDTSKVVFPTGNVGIGPSVNTSLGKLAVSQSAGTQASGFALHGDNGKAYMYMSGSTSKLAIQSGFTGGGSILLNPNGDGNVGIGNTNPTHTVEIGTDGGGEKILKMHSDTASSYFEIQSLGNVARLLATNNTNLLLQSDGTGGYITFNANSAERMRIDSSGRLLLNSTSTSFSDKLYINGDAYVNGAWRVGTSSTYVGKLYNTSGILTLESDSTRDIQFGSVTNGTAMFIEGTNGNVGIGTTSPAKLLTVAGEAQFTGEVFFNGGFDVTSGTVSRFRDDIPLHFGINRVFELVYDSTSDKLEFNSGSNAIMTLDGDGNLVVEGSITATSFTGSFNTTPTSPTNLSLTQEDGTVVVQFTSASGEVHRYEVWSSVGDETNYNLIGALNEDNFTASIQIVDDTFNKNDTIYYTVYSLRNGKYSDSLTGNIAVTGNVADVTGMRVMESLHGYHLEWVLPDDNRLQQVNVKVDSSATLAGLSEANSTTFYSGLAEQTFYEVPEADANKYHQFWIDSVTRT